MTYLAVDGRTPLCRPLAKPRRGAAYWQRCLVIAGIALAASAHAQADEPPQSIPRDRQTSGQAPADGLPSTPDVEASLVDREPFDQVVLREEAGGQVLDVQTLDVPRPLPSLPSEGELKLRLLNRPTEEFAVSWSDVAEIRLFEQSLLAEARRLSDEGKFDEAFDYFARLQANFPNYPGLDKAINQYLRNDARRLAAAKQYDRALAVLLSLVSRNPKMEGLASEIDQVAGALIEFHLRQQEFSAARSVLDLWQTKLSSAGPSGADAWQQRFESAAQRQIAEAKQLVAANDFVNARRLVGRAVKIWPDLPEAQELLAKIQRESPSVIVGVFVASPQAPVFRIDDWAATRASRLVNPLLVEQFGFNTEGGVYRSPFGDLEVDDSSTRLTLKLKPLGDQRRFTTDSLVRYLLRMADPDDALFRGDFAANLAAISAPKPDVVALDWKHPHVRPEALLQVAPPPASSGDMGSTAEVSTAPFSRVASDENSAMFRSRLAPVGNQRAVQTIVERTFESDEGAVAALLAGEIDVLERVPPWHLERLRAAPGIHVQAYRLPTVHVLVPNMDRELPARREFRRALCFAVNRDWIVRSLLLAGAEMPGFEVVSGPFPAGLSLGDPIRYAYNNQVLPRTYEPRLGAILATVAWTNIVDPEGKGSAEVGEIPELVLAHPADPTIRVACQAIREQLLRVGIRLALHEHSSDDLADGRVEYDLRYAELTLGEPLVDAQAVLGPAALARRPANPYLDASLRRLSDASNWKDVRACLSEIHEIAHQELPVIPLWQAVNHMAFRDNVRGIAESPIALYQEIERWNVVDDRELASDAPTSQVSEK